MKVMVTGAKGQLGKVFTEMLIKKKGFDVIPLSHNDLDISNKSCVYHYVNKEKPDLIINCSAFNAVDLCETEWEKAFRVNGLGPKNLAIAANNCSSILIHFSTDFVFKGDMNRAYTIADIPNPTNKYGLSKLLGEKMVVNHASKYLLIRTSSLFGEGYDNFPQRIINLAKNNTSLSVVLDQISSPTYTYDLARTTFDLINNDEIGLFHITNSGSCSRYEWAEYILERIGWNGELKKIYSHDLPKGANRPAFSALDNFGLEEVIGYHLPDWKDATLCFLTALDSVN